MTLGTEVLVLPQRQPTLVAKQVSTLDTLSGGRVRLGVGVGWQESEYEALGEDFHTRGARMDEAIRLLRAYWSDAEVSFAGAHYRDGGHGDGAQAAAGRRGCRSGSAATPRPRFRRVGPARRRLARQPGHRRGRRAARPSRRSTATPRRPGAIPARIGLQSMVAPPPRDAAGKRFYAEPRRAWWRASPRCKAMGFGWVALNATAIFQAGARSVDAMIDALATLHDRLRAEVG